MDGKLKFEIMTMKELFVNLNMKKFLIAVIIFVSLCLASSQALAVNCDFVSARILASSHIIASNNRAYYSPDALNYDDSSIFFAGSIDSAKSNLQALQNSRMLAGNYANSNKAVNVINHAIDFASKNEIFSLPAANHNENAIIHANSNSSENVINHTFSEKFENVPVNSVASAIDFSSHTVNRDKNAIFFANLNDSENVINYVSPEKLKNAPAKFGAYLMDLKVLQNSRITAINLENSNSFTKLDETALVHVNSISLSESAKKATTGSNATANTTKTQAPAKFGIIGAMDIEVDLLKSSAIITHTEKIAGMDFCAGRLGNSDVIIVKSGMGKVNAGICAQLLISQFGATHIINTGIAGALNPSLNIGDLVIAIDCVQHDFDNTQSGFKLGEIPYTGRFAFESDKDMRREILDVARKTAPDINIIEGRICTGDQFISSKAQKDLIIANFNGDCCDMESGAIAQVCYLNKIPFASIRAISDKADSNETIDFHEFTEVTAKLSALIVKSILEGR